MKLGIISLSLLVPILATFATSPPALAQENTCKSPIMVKGFLTCANVAVAEKEGSLTIYSPDVEQATAKLLQAFEADFPKIKTRYVRLQTGALYSKLMVERQAGSYLVDVVNLSDMGLVQDFMKRDGYLRYVSPQLSAYEDRFKSKPEGYYTFGALIMAGIAYNPKEIKPQDVPKDWKDLNNPKWSGKISVKSANSGLEYATWYMLTKEYGESYWNAFFKQRPRPFDASPQQFDRLVNGEDKFAHTAQYSVYLDFKAKGAPLAFVPPATGLPTSPEVWGIVKQAPDPQAARLFTDWFLSQKGQTVMANVLYMHSARKDVAPPPGGIALSKMKLLVPSDWVDYGKHRREFLKLWGKLSGLR